MSRIKWYEIPKQFPRELQTLEGDILLGGRFGPPEKFLGFVTQLSPKRIEIVELLKTKAPNPTIAQPYCCYIDTVIFYLRPYVVRPWHLIWNCNGKLKAQKPGGRFEEWDRARHALRWDTVFNWNGQKYEVGGGMVFWKYKRWWMIHSARLRETA